MKSRSDRFSFTLFFLLSVASFVVRYVRFSGGRITRKRIVFHLAWLLFGRKNRDR